MQTSRSPSRDHSLFTKATPTLGCHGNWLVWHFLPCPFYADLTTDVRSPRLELLPTCFLNFILMIVQLTTSLGRLDEIWHFQGNINHENNLLGGSSFTLSVPSFILIVSVIKPFYQRKYFKVHSDIKDAMSSGAFSCLNTVTVSHINAASSYLLQRVRQVPITFR